MEAFTGSERATVRLLGLGNEILADDAFGIHVAREVQRRFPGQVEVVCSSASLRAAISSRLSAFTGGRFSRNSRTVPWLVATIMAVAYNFSVRRRRLTRNEEPSAKDPSLPRRRALRARTNLPQIEPRINSQIVFIVPRKLQRILAHCLRRQRFHRRLEHRQSPRRQLRRLARLSSRLPALILAKRARTSIPQERKRIGGPVSILPFNLHPRARRQMNQHRLGIVPHPRRKIRQRHKFQYRTPPAPHAVSSKVGSGSARFPRGRR